MSIVLMLMAAVFVVCSAVPASAAVEAMVYEFVPGKLLDDMYEYIKKFLKCREPLGKLENDAAKGDPEARSKLGMIYFFGEEDSELYKIYKVSKNYEEAFYWLDLAARAHDRKEAQNLLGYMYEDGKWVHKNYVEAVEWYRKAAEQDYAPAQYNLGRMYYFGNGVKEDEAEAIKWVRKAAEQGLAKSQFILGFMYEFGDGVPEDKTEAVKLYRKAAQQGYTDAQDVLRQLGETC